MGSLGYNNNNKVVVVVLIVLLLLVIYHTAGGEGSSMEWLCNTGTFASDDDRLICVYALMEKLMGPEVPVVVGAWYKNETCGDSTIYGYRRADKDGTGCLDEAKDVIENTQCHHRVGAQAWDDGCLLRFELYPFEVIS